jgi:hypothetical protein
VVVTEIAVVAVVAVMVVAFPTMIAPVVSDDDVIVRAVIGVGERERGDHESGEGNDGGNCF